MNISNTLKKIITVFIAAVILITTNALFGIHSEAAEGNLIIMLDPGHGGIDGGAENTVSGVYYNENKLMMKVANYAKEELSQYPGVTVLLTRESTQTYMRLAERVSKATANGAHAIISIHANSYSGSSAKGAEALVASGNYKSDVANATQSIGNKILSQLESIGVKNRGIKTRLDNQDEIIEYYPDGSVQDYYGIVQRALRAGIPGVIIETAFISNDSDVQNFFSSDFKLQTLGKAIATGIAKHYGLSKNTTAKAQQRPRVDARELTFSGNPDTSFLYPMKGTKITQSSGYATLTKGSDGIKIYIDYRGMAFSADTYKYATIRLKSSSPGASATITTGAHEITYDTDAFTYKATLDTEYKNILLDMVGGVDWTFSVNFIKIQISGTDSADIESIKFYESKSAINDGSAASKPIVTQTPKPATAKPTVTQPQEPTSTAKPAVTTTTANTATAVNNISSPAIVTSPTPVVATSSNDSPTQPTHTVPMESEYTVKASAPIQKSPISATHMHSLQNTTSKADNSDRNSVAIIILASILLIIAFVSLYIIQLLQKQSKNKENNKYE